MFHHSGKKDIKLRINKDLTKFNYAFLRNAGSHKNRLCKSE